MDSALPTLRGREGGFRLGGQGKMEALAMHRGIAVLACLSVAGCIADAPSPEPTPVSGCVVESNGAPALQFGVGGCKGGKVVEVVRADPATLENAARTAADVMSCPRDGTCRYRIDADLMEAMTPATLLSAKPVFQGVLLSFSSDGDTIVELLIEKDGNVVAMPSILDPEGA